MGHYSFCLEAPDAPTFRCLWLLWRDLPLPPLGDSLLPPSLRALGQFLVSWSPVESGQFRQRGPLRQCAALWPGRWQWAHIVGSAWKRRMGRETISMTANPPARTASAMSGGRSNLIEVEGVHPAGVRRLRR